MNTQAIQFLQVATVLDRESHSLASGQAVLYTTLHSGEFLPTPQSSTVTLDTLPQRASILKASDGHLYKLRPDKTLCEGHNKPPHFHFDYEDV